MNLRKIKFISEICLFSVNLDTLNAVLEIYSIYFADVANFIPDYRNFMTALPIYVSLRRVKHLNFILNFLIHLQLLKCLKTAHLCK